MTMYAYEEAKPSFATIRAEEAPPDCFGPWVEVSTESLAWNIDQVRERVAGTPLMAVVKCNAYGHGLVGTARVMQDEGIERFAVAKVSEGVALRENGIRGMILNFGGFSDSEADLLVEFGISQSVYSARVESLARAARERGRRIGVHIKLDTGLGRVGVPYREAAAFIEKVSSLPEIAIDGVFTTLTEEDDFDPVQTGRLLNVYEEAREKGISLGVRHTASSLGVAGHPPPYLDMARPGNCLLGIEPLPNLLLRPAMALKTRVMCVKEMQSGDTIGYHRHFEIERDSRVAVISVGYSDGYPLTAVGNAEVLIAGRRWPVIGFMSANHAFVDISGEDGIGVGDEVVLFGTQKGVEISIGELSEWGGVGPYHTAIAISPMLPRVFI